MSKPNHGVLLSVFGAFLTLLAAEGPLARAAEVTVQNDSLTGGQTGAIQAGFAAGERAAAWLTSPCNGSIVAVQVFWRSFFGGAPPVLGDVITIYGDGVFPVPGPVLNNSGVPPIPAELFGPVMTDGVINEFRFLDEQMSIPLNVPVTAGQRFVVSFQFFDDAGVFGPSVVTDTGCQPSKNAIYAVPPGAWFNSCALGVSGDFVIRAVINCPDPTGACCLPNGSCIDNVTSAACAAQGGIYRGNGVLCSAQMCPEFPRACCFASGGGTCQNLTPSQCIGFGGTPGPAGSACATYVCFPMGACCLPDGSCIGPVSPAACSAQSGNFQGHMTTCAGVMCPQPIGACCSATGFCAELTAAQCNGIPGATWRGPGTTCADADMDGTADICETQQPCPGDANGDRTVGLGDIAVLIQNWGLSVPPAPAAADLDGNGSIGLGDIAVVIDNWGLVCP